MIGDVINAPKSISGSMIALWVAFILVHVWSAFVGLNYQTVPWGDVLTQYKPWALDAVSGTVVGVSTSWVYPALALLPMLAALSLGPDLYGIAWFLIVLILDSLALLLILRLPLVFGVQDASRARVAGWWWTIFLLFLGPVALGRIDAITVALAVCCIALARRMPKIAGVLLSVAMWIKVWPAVLFAVLITAAKNRIQFLLAFSTMSVAVALGSLALGSGSNVVGFAFEQGSRGLQVEAPVSSIWMWWALIDPSQARVNYNASINTYEVLGRGVGLVSHMMTPLLVITTLASISLGILAIRRGARPLDAAMPMAVALVSGLLVFNKVGSPQFVAWLAVPVIFSILFSRRRPATLALILLAIAALTQVVYPYGYSALLFLDPVMVTILTLRNVLVTATFASSFVALWRLMNARRAPQELR